MRSLLKRTPFETKEVDLNELAREAFAFLSMQASARNVALYLRESPENVARQGRPDSAGSRSSSSGVNSNRCMANIPTADGSP